ncbi:dynein axonemal assembly factor 8 [Macrotis lagotis]|uniref:dynein axonemal assembly factor 8 n=1 Tax=Macrotis lagotis TaxID=92651 RepID=UPI003D681C45
MASDDKQDHPSGHNQLPCIYDISMWGSILTSVKDQLPSFDSDSSSSDDDDGELFIFQRDEEDLIPDLTDELADDPEIQLLESVIGPGKNWYRNIKDLAILEEKDASQPLLLDPAFEDTEEIKTGIHFRITEESTKWQRGDTWDLFRSRVQALQAQALIPGPQVEEFSTSTCNRDLTRDNLEGGHFSFSEESDSTGIKAIRKELRRMIEKNILHKEIKESSLKNLSCSQFTKPIALESTESDDMEEKSSKYEGLKLRSLEILEEWDLDKILQNLEAKKGQRECLSRLTYWEADSSFKGQESHASNSQDRLMEQLITLCAKQSKGLSLPQKKPDGKLCYPTEDQVRSRSSRCMPCLTRGQSLDVARNTELQKVIEPPTVFIDLRQPKLKTSVPSSEYRFQKKEEKFSSGDSSSTESEETPDVRDAKGPRKRISQSSRDQTGKSYLLQQIRAFQKTSRSCGTKTKVNTQDGHDTQDAKTFEDIFKTGIRRKQGITRETHQNTSVMPLGYLPPLDQEARGRGEKSKRHRQESRFRKINCSDGNSFE